MCINCQRCGSADPKRPKSDSTRTFEEEIDLMAVRAERENLKAELAKLEEQMAVYLKELGYE